jgi:CRISPR type IV-associated protein Csf1
MVGASSEIATLGKLLPFRMPGNCAGRCIACGKHTAHGVPARLPDTFTAAYKLYNGNALCEYCAPLFKERSLRSRSWVASQSEFRYIQRSEWLTTLTEPPEPPFAIYFTLSGQKYGYLSLIRRVSTNRDRYWLATDWQESPILIHRAQLAELVPIAQQLRTHGVPKTQLLTAQFSPTIVAKAIKEGWDTMLRTIEQLRGNPAWEVVVYAAD